MGNRKCRLEPAGLCGTSIDTENVIFGDRKPNLVYMDKVFSFNSDTSCPVFFFLDTRCDSDNFEIKFTTADKGCGCGCNPYELDCNAVFEIEKAFAVLDFIGIVPPGNISPSQVTIDGEEVDSVTFDNGRFIVGISELVSRLQHQQCIDSNLPSKNFLLIRDICTWEIRATYVLEGTVTSGGRTCCFRAEIRNADDAPSTVLPTSCCSSFAIPNFSIPCTTNGIAPEIAFHFSGNIKLINPQLKVKCHNRPCPVPVTVETAGVSAEIFPGMDRTPTLVFKSKVSLEPTVHVESVRRTLFSVNAQEGIIPCRSIAGELESERRKTTDPCNNLPGYGFHHSNTCTLSSNFGCRIDSSPSCNGVRRDDRKPCRIRDDICRDNRNPCRFTDNICGDFRGDFCDDFFDELIEDICDEIFCRSNRHFRSCVDFDRRHCDDWTGCRDECEKKPAKCRPISARNACQFFGSNGCSW